MEATVLPVVGSQIHRRLTITPIAPTVTPDIVTALPTAGTLEAMAAIQAVGTAAVDTVVAADIDRTVP